MSVWISSNILIKIHNHPVPVQIKRCFGVIKFVDTLLLHINVIILVSIWHKKIKLAFQIVKFRRNVYLTIIRPLLIPSTDTINLGLGPCMG